MRMLIATVALAAVLLGTAIWLAAKSELVHAISGIWKS